MLAPKAAGRGPPRDAGGRHDRHVPMVPDDLRRAYRVNYGVGLRVSVAPGRSRPNDDPGRLPGGSPAAILLPSRPSAPGWDRPPIQDNRLTGDDAVLDLDRFTILTFDCYGTLIDWERGILAALQPLLARHGVARSDDHILELYGELETAAEHGPYRPYREVLTQAVDGLGQRLGFTPSEAERTTLADSVGQWPPFPDTVESLHALAENYQLGILSNIDDALFAKSAPLLATDFATVVTAEQVGSYKPNPRNFQILIERLGMPREQILHVAQSLFHDVAPARDAGLATVWVNRRHDRPGFGATPASAARPDLEVPDLATLARLAAETRR
jgi:2-haloacid dehalogenase